MVRITDDEGKGRTVTIVSDDGTEDAYTVPTLARLEVTEGQEIQAGDPLIEGPRDPKELLEIKGIRETQQYLVTEVQKVYRDQGVPIHDKHIELIVRQMTRRIARQRVFPYGMEDGWALEVYDFLTAVRDGRPSEIDGEEGLRAKAIALAIYESSATGQAVRLKDVLDGTVDTYQRPINEKWGI